MNRNFESAILLSDYENLAVAKQEAQTCAAKYGHTFVVMNDNGKILARYKAPKR